MASTEEKLVREKEQNMFFNEIKGFRKGMVGLMASTEEKLVREKEQNMFYFNRKSPEFPLGCTITRQVVRFLSP